jgi:hypothetical protein
LITGFLCDAFANQFALLPLAQPGHGRPEEEHPQDGEQDKKLEQDEPYQGPAPGHIPEAVPVKLPHCPQMMHTSKLGFFIQKTMDEAYVALISKPEKVMSHLFRF